MVEGRNDETVKRTYYKDNNQLQYECPYVNGQWHGIVRWWHRNGIVEGETPYKDGLQHGIQRWYAKDGTLLWEIAWVYGERRDDLLKEENKFARLILFGEE